MPIDFPNSPTTNQEFTATGRTWIYDGAKWVAKLAYGAHGATHAATGTDAVLLEQSQVNTLPATLLGKVETASYDVAGKNKIINGGFDFWQRGTSGTVVSALYSADRWICDPGSMNASWSQQAFAPGAAPVAGYEGQYFYRFTSNSGSGGFPKIQQRIEDVRTFAGKTVTLSFWAKASVGKSEPQVLLMQNFGSGGSANVFTNLPNYTSTTGWQRFSFTATLPSIAGKTIGAGNYLDIMIQMVNVGTYSFDIWGVQLEAGSVATAFSRAAGTLQGELAACQRYFYKMTQSMVVGSGAIRSSTLANPVVHHPVEMRTPPTYTPSSAAAVAVWEIAGPIISNLLGTFAGTARATIMDVSTPASLTAGRGAICVIATGQSIEWSAEL